MLTSASQPLHRLQTAKRIAVVRALPGLGDFLCAVPAYRALRAALPDAQVTLIGLDSTKDLTCRFGRYLDEHLSFPGFPGIDEAPFQARDLPPFLSAIHADPFDLVIQMHGSGVTSNPFAVLLGGRVTAGFYLSGHYCPDPYYFLLYREGESEVLQLLRLMELLGFARQGDDLEFPLQEADYVEFLALTDRYSLRHGAYVCLHPGASRPDRRWPPAYFAAVGDRLVSLGFQVLLTGISAEMAITAEVAARMTHEPIDLTGRTNLGALALLLRSAGLLITNDTGLSHLASAMRTPSIILFTTSDPGRWAPLDPTRHRALDERGMGQGTADITKKVTDEALLLLALSETEATVV
jgi:ADP-heptose:LPS heptosyltransferase